MPSSLVKLDYKKVKDSVPPADAKEINKKEHYFKITYFINGNKIDPLVDVEVALRRGERVGLFSNGNAKKKRNQR